MFLKIVKSPAMANCFIFIAGIQISACINLFTGICLEHIALEKSYNIIAAGASFGIAGMLSFLIGSVTDSIVGFIEKTAGTVLEKESERLIKEKLDEAFSFKFCEMKKLSMIKFSIFLDFVITLGSIVLLTIT